VFLPSSPRASLSAESAPAPSAEGAPTDAPFPDALPERADFPLVPDDASPAPADVPPPSFDVPAAPDDLSVLDLSALDVSPPDFKPLAAAAPLPFFPSASPRPDVFPFALWDFPFPRADPDLLPLSLPLLALPDPPPLSALAKAEPARNPSLECPPNAPGHKVTGGAITSPATASMTRLPRSRGVMIQGPFCYVSCI
jgi:hypothetical protein